MTTNRDEDGGEPPPSPRATPTPTKQSGNTNLQLAIERAAKPARQTGRDTTTASRQHWRTTMLRKVTLGLIAAASLSVAAVAPASAHGFHGGGWSHHGGWGHGFGRPHINHWHSACHRQLAGCTP